jgi:hypothetical protein
MGTLHQVQRRSGSFIRDMSGADSMGCIVPELEDLVNRLTGALPARAKILDEIFFTFAYEIKKSWYSSRMAIPVRSTILQKGPPLYEYLRKF